MASDLYFHFRRMNVPDGYIVGLSVFDMSESNLVDSNTDAALKLNGDVVATPRLRELATYPDFLRAGNIYPALYFEAHERQFAHKLNPGVNRFECVGPQGDSLSHAAFFGLPCGVSYPVPDPDNMKRVGGTIKADGFIVSGASWYAVFTALLQRELGNIHRDAAILDWGVGCGRIARYFLHDNFTNLHGIDIDQFNINWCKTNLPGGTFSRCDFDPPTTYEDKSFVAIYAHSVFTHLNQESEIAWLKEVARLLQPDGIACCTIASEFTSRLNHNVRIDKNPEFLNPLMATGRQDFGADTTGVDVGRKNYYRRVTHARQYIFDTWSKYVDIKEIIPGFADSQDAVVFSRKRPTADRIA